MILRLLSARSSVVSANPACRWGFLLLLALLDLAGLAQPAPITTDGRFGPAQSFSGSAMTIPESAGLRTGANLFHSFTRFNIPTGTTAAFTGDTAIQNVLARVTGAEPSTIDGTLRVTIPGANLFLMNPNGVVFGPGASLDVGGNVAIVTAGSIHLGDGNVFAAQPALSETLTTAAPEAFGFLASPSPGSVTFNGANLALRRGRELLIVGGDILAQTSGDRSASGATLTSVGGTIKLAAVKSTGRLEIAAWDVTRFGSLGNITLQGADALGRTETALIVSGSQAGNILLKAGNITLRNSASLQNDISGPSRAGQITLDARETITFSGNGRIAARSLDGSAGGKAPPIHLKATNILFLQNGRVNARSQSGRAGEAGDVSVEATNIIFDGTTDDDTLLNSGIYTQTLTGAAGGNITVNASGSLSLRNDGQITSSASGGGRAGDIVIRADAVTLINAGIYAEQADGRGIAGRLALDITGTLSILNGGIITTNTYGDGDAGSITVRAGDIRIDRGSSPFSTGIFAYGNEADTLSGRGGDITVESRGSISLNRGGVQSGSWNPAASGNISISSAQLALTNSSSIDSANRNDIGSAGRISLTVAQGSLSLENSRINSSIVGGRAADRGGNISIVARDIRLVDGSLVTSHVSGASSAGRGGDISVNAAGSIVMEGARTEISSSLFGADSNGRAGDLRITAGSLTLRNQAVIYTATVGNGNAGNIAVELAGALTIEGDGSAEQTGIYSNSVDLNAPAPGVPRGNTPVPSGNAGEINVGARSISITNEGQISTLSFSAGRAGGITLRVVEDLLIDGQGRYTTGVSAASTAFSRGGDTGDINITARNITLRSGGLIDNNSVSSQSGQLNVRASGAIVIDATAPGSSLTGLLSGRVSPDGVPILAGRAGAVTVSGASIRLDGRFALIGSFSNSGDAGSVSLTSTAGNIELNHGAQITVRSSSASSIAGDIILSTPRDMLLLGGSKLDASASGRGGNIRADARFIVLSPFQAVDGASITAHARAGSGGILTLNALSLLPSDARLLDVDSEAGSPGTLTLRTQIDLGGSLQLSRVDFLRAADRVRLECQRDEAFANTLDTSTIGPGTLHSPSTFQLPRIVSD